MKRTFIKGILSAAFVATCLVARGVSVVYSQNAGDFFLGSTNDVCFETSTIWEAGIIAVGECHVWTDASGRVRNGPHKAADPIRSSTWFQFGCIYKEIPLSPKHTAIVGATGLMIVGLIIGGGLLLKRSNLSHVNRRTD